MKLRHWIWILCLLPLAVTAQRKKIRVARGSASSLEFAFEKVRDYGSIIIPEGVYEIDKPLELLDKEHVRVIGRGKVEIRQTDRFAHVVSVRNSNDIGLAGLTLYHTAPDPEEVCTGYVVNLIDVANVRVESCDLNGCGNTGIFGLRVAGLKIVDSFIHNNSEWGVRASDELGNYVEMVNGFIHAPFITQYNNTILNNGTEAQRMESLIGDKEFTSHEGTRIILTGGKTKRQKVQTDSEGLKIFAEGTSIGMFAGTEWGDFAHFLFVKSDYVLDFLVVACPEFETFDADPGLRGRMVRIHWVEREFDLREFSGMIEKGFAVTEIELLGED